MGKSKFVRSDIPYRDRLLMNKFNTIAQHRDHAALTAMKIAMLALDGDDNIVPVKQLLEQEERKNGV